MELKEYVQSYENYFWEWQTDADIADDLQYSENNLISMPNVGPIIYRTYLTEILNELKSEGFPPFGSLLLILFATQDGYIQLEEPFNIIKKLPFTTRKNVEASKDGALEFLTKLHSLKSHYKSGKSRLILLKTLFKYRHNTASSGSAEMFLNKLRKRPYKLEECAEKKILPASVVIKDIGFLAHLNAKFPTAESIIDALKGFIKEPELNDEIAREDITDETDKDFIQQLTEDPKTFQIGSLIKRIWSGLKIPMKHLSPGEQPIGGVSDMTNKGDFHQMLLSEFANDDNIFVSRIANNEVLYIQREIPPEENIFERIILIDTSLKTWGTPKILAFASSIAIIKHPKANSECKVFALGKTYFPISLDSVAEVVEHLNSVSPVLDVSESLDKFFEEHQEKNLEVFLITNRENLQFENLQRVVNENRDRLKFLVTTSLDGELDFYKHHNGTRKHVQKIYLPLKELWTNPPGKKSANNNQNRSSGNKTPVPKNYPLLFPAPKNKIDTFLYEGELFILTAKKQLLKTYLSNNYYNKLYYDNYRIHRGCEVVIENISVKPKGLFALARNRQQEYILCQYFPDKKLITKLNLNTKEFSELNVTGQNIPLNFELMYFNKNFYLYQEKYPTLFKINIEGNLTIETVKHSDELDRNHDRIILEKEKLSGNDSPILSNINSIGINYENHLMVSNWELLKHYEGSMMFIKSRKEIIIRAERFSNKFTFPDGSEIITDTRGMLTFKSSNDRLPRFYIPSVQNTYLAIATTSEFGGSEYFLPSYNKLKMKKMEEMSSGYLEVFIQQILDYETAD